MRSFGLVWAAVAACGDPTKTTTGDTGTPVTDSPTVTDTPTDTGTVDTDTTEPVPPQDVRFAIDGAWEGTALLVYGVDLDFGVTTGLHASSVADGAFVNVTLPPPPPSALLPLDPSDPSTLAAFYLAGLVADADGDGAKDAGEAYVGVSPAVLVYIEAEGGLSLPYKVLGIHAGWNALDLDTLSGYPSAFPLDAIPVSAPAQVTTASISGTFTGKGAPRIALVPGNQYGPFTDVLYDAEAGDWAIAVDGEPPASHLVYGSSDIPDGSALEIPASYDDLDGSASLTAGDVAIDPACTADQRDVVLAWFPHLEDLFVTYLLEARSGWMVIADPEAEFEILGAEVTDLSIGPCGP